MLALVLRYIIFNLTAVKHTLNWDLKLMFGIINFYRTNSLKKMVNFVMNLEETGELIIYL